MNKKGFTLVELMVVIVIIGVLAAVAIPRMMAATDKARAAEGPQILGSIARMQHAVFAEHGVYINCATQANPLPIASDWGVLGFSQNPKTNYFTFGVTAIAANVPDPLDGTITSVGNTFLAQAIIINKIGAAMTGERVQVDHLDNRRSDPNLNLLIGSYGAKSPLTAPTPPTPPEP